MRYARPVAEAGHWRFERGKVASSLDALSTSHDVAKAGTVDVRTWKESQVEASGYAHLADQVAVAPATALDLLERDLDE